MKRLIAALLVTLTAPVTAVGLAGTPPTRISRTIDTRLCPFPLKVTVASKEDIAQAGTSVLHFSFVGPTTITLRNGSTGRTATLAAPDAFSTNTKTGTVTFHGNHVWFWASGNHVPFASTSGTGSFVAPNFVLTGRSQARVVDPCALVASVPPSARPRTTRAPWPLPAYALSQIAYAGLTPVLGALRRHDHVHLDVVVDGRKMIVPAGVGMGEPHDTGPCPHGLPPEGDCSTGHVLFAEVANSPLHTHSASGLIHIESDRPGRFTLGEFFDEWGVRLDASCLGGYCSGNGSELRVFVNGRTTPGNPRRIVLTNRQEIAVVFGGKSDFGSVPSTYRGGWPGLGCGGPGERSCLP